MILTVFEEMILLLLEKQWLYGLQIQRALREITGTEPGFGSLYPTLNKLNNAKLLISRWGDNDHPRRRYYTIHPNGLDVLRVTAQVRGQLSDWRDRG